jgi:hypothetical protein
LRHRPTCSWRGMPQRATIAAPIHLREATFTGAFTEAIILAARARNTARVHR